MGKMMKYDPARGEALRKLIEDAGYSATMKKMFGHDTWFLNGYMYAGCNTDGVFVHIGEEAAIKAVAEHDNLSPFSPGRDMIMKDYIQINEPSAGDDRIVSEWLKRSATYLESLPEKVKKAKKKKA